MDFITVLLQLCAGVSVVGGAAAIIIKMFNPYKVMKKEIEKHNIILERDLERFKQIEEANKLLYSCLYALLDHCITGNSFEKLKEAKDSLNKYLINR